MTDTPAELHVVTGAFGFTGRHVARRLLDRGRRVRTLTGRSTEDSPFGDRVEIAPYSWDEPAKLTDSLRGASVVYNTYWVRFPHKDATHDAAVVNTRTLIRCAVEAGVRRFVQISITNPSLDSPLSYFRGKARLEAALVESGLSYAIVRPAVFFGAGDILLNNIAWMLRRLPVFGVFGRGDSRVQPVFVEDVADLMVDLGERDDNVTLDAVGPETFTFEEMVRLIRTTVKGRARIIHVSPRVGWLIGRILGRLVGDVLITREEIDGLMSDLLVSDAPPTCPTRLTDWLQQHSATLGAIYASELSRHYARR